MTCSGVLGYKVKNYTFLAKQGADESITLTFTDEDGTALNLTGYTFTGQVRPAALSATLSASFTFDTTNATTGIIIATLAGPATASLSPGENTRDNASIFYYDMRYTVSSVSTYFLQGQLILDRRVTR